jgi:hypothetical protein
MKACAWCNGDIPARARPDAKFCGVRCRQRSHRFDVARAELAAAARPMRFAFADPPYPGKAHYYPEQQEVDHELLVRHLVDVFPDGWALSTSAEALPSVLALCPTGARVCAWFKGARPPSSRRTTIRPTRAKRALSAWEPLIVYGGRRPLPTDQVHDLADGLIARGRHRSHPDAMIGMKPPAFAEWMFRQLGAAAGDTLVDVFPGSGAIGRAWSLYTSPEYSGDVSQLELGDAFVAAAPAAAAPSLVYQGIGHQRGDCFCDTCRYIVSGQLRALLASVPAARRLELLAALDVELVAVDEASRAAAGGDAA